MKKENRKRGGCLKRFLLGTVCFLVAVYGALYVMDRFDIKPSAIPYTYNMFSDISQLQEKLAPYVVEFAQDPYAGGVVCEESYCSFVEYGNIRYRVTGYVFPDVLSAARYYTCNVWGETWNAYDEEVLKYNTRQAQTRSEAFIGTKHAVFNDRSVLVIETEKTGTGRLAEFENWLTADFPLQYYTEEEQQLLASMRE